jgi:hypothetical protein
MQLLLPLIEPAAPAPLVWERLAPGEQAEAVAVLARLMAHLVQPVPEPEEEHSDD